MSTTVIQDFVAQFNFVVNQTSVNNTVNNINNVNNAANNAANTAARAEFSFGKLAAGMAAVGVAVVGLEKSTIKYATSLRDTYYEAQRLGFSSSTAVNHFKAIQQGANDAGLAIGTIEDAIHSTIKAMDMYGAGALSAARKWAPRLTGKEAPEEQTMAILEGMRNVHRAHPEQDTLLYNDWYAQQMGHDVVHDYINSKESAADYINKRRKEIGSSQDAAVSTAIKLTQDYTSSINAYDSKLAEGMIPTMKLADEAVNAFTESIKRLPPEAALTIHFLSEFKEVIAGVVGVLALLGLGGGIVGTGAAALGAIGTTIGTAIIGALGLTAGYGVGTGINKLVEDTTGSTIGGKIYDWTHEEYDPNKQGKENAGRRKHAVAVLMQSGLSREASEGYVANFLRESTNWKTGQEMDPSLFNQYGFGGISQWSSDRQEDFKSFAGYDMSDTSISPQKKFDDELKFAANELISGKYKSIYTSMKGMNHTAGDWGSSLSRRVVVPFDPIKHPNEFNAAAEQRARLAEGIHQTNNITINAGSANAEEVKNKLQNATTDKLSQVVRERSSKGMIR